MVILCSHNYTEDKPVVTDYGMDFLKSKIDVATCA